MTTICFVVGKPEDPILTNANQMDLIRDVLSALASAKEFNISNHRISIQRGHDTLQVFLDSGRNEYAGRGVEHVFRIERISILNPFLTQPERMFRGVGIAPLRFKDKPKIITQNMESGPDIFVVPVVGLRSDGCEFTIDIAVDSEKLGQTSGPDAFMGLIQQLQIAFAKLSTYRDCSCNKEIVCKEHTPPVPN